jgi:hypothetical protein
MSSAPALELHPERLLPADPGAPAIARRLHRSVAKLVVISPHGHGHVPACRLGDGTPLPERASLVTEQRLDEDEVLQLAHDLVGTCPQGAFEL